MKLRGVSFDFGDTIVALDERLLLQKIQRLGLSAPLARLELRFSRRVTPSARAIANGDASHPGSRSCRRCSSTRAQHRQRSFRGGA